MLSHRRIVYRDDALFRRAFSLLLACGLVLFSVSSGRAQPVSMSGAHITIVVGLPPGGGYDAYARLLGRHLGAFLPGNPGTVVQNMPGAGSLIAANWLANSAPRDGTAIALLPSWIPLEGVFGNSGAHFDARQLNFLGSLNTFTSVAMVWHDTPFLTARDLLTDEVLVGAGGVSAGTSVLPNLLNSLVHTKFKVVNGYAGTADIALALERGEVQAMFNDWDFVKGGNAEWLRDKKVRILLQIAQTRMSDLPDVPTPFELGGSENHDVLALLIARQAYSGLFLAPPGVPAPVVAALRQGFVKMADDADFRRDAEQARLLIRLSGADEVTATIDKVLASPQPVIDRAIAELRRFNPQ